MRIIDVVRMAQNCAICDDAGRRYYLPAAPLIGAIRPIAVVTAPRHTLWWQEPPRLTGTRTVAHRVLWWQRIVALVISLASHRIPAHRQFQVRQRRQPPIFHAHVVVAAKIAVAVAIAAVIAAHLPHATRHATAHLPGVQSAGLPASLVGVRPPLPHATHAVAGGSASRHATHLAHLPHVALAHAHAAHRLHHAHLPHVALTRHATYLAHAAHLPHAAQAHLRVHAHSAAGCGQRRCALLLLLAVRAHRTDGTLHLVLAGGRRRKVTSAGAARVQRGVGLAAIGQTHTHHLLKLAHDQFQTLGAFGALLRAAGHLLSNFDNSLHRAGHAFVLRSLLACRGADITHRARHICQNRINLSWWNLTATL